MNGRLHFGETLLNFVGDTDDIDFDTPTGGTRNKGDASIAQFKRTQYLVSHRYFFLRLRAQADTDGITDAIGQQQAKSNGGFDRTADERASLGNAKVQGIV